MPEGKSKKDFRTISPIQTCIKASTLVFIALGALFVAGQIKQQFSQNGSSKIKPPSSVVHNSTDGDSIISIKSQVQASNQSFSRKLDVNSKQYQAMAIDPAVEIKERIWIYPDSETPWLNNVDQYRRAAGDLARVQERMLINREKSRDYPWILIGDGRYNGEECSPKDATLGIYMPPCHRMQINFKADKIVYEQPIEVLTAMMHEQGHHLINLTIGSGNRSRLDQELIADCFAGVMHGYWAKWDKLSEEEFLKAGTMMIQISKHEEGMTEHGDKGQRLGAFVAGAARAGGKITPQYMNYCLGLEDVLDFSKGLP